MENPKRAGGSKQSKVKYTEFLTEWQVSQRFGRGKVSGNDNHSSKSFQFNRFQSSKTLRKNKYGTAGVRSGPICL